MCALHIHVVFEGHWHACKRAKLIEITGGKRVIDELRGSKRRFRGEFEIGMHRRVGFRNMIDARLSDLACGEIARFKALLYLCCIHRSEVHAIHLRQGSQGSRSNRLLASVRSRAPFLAKSSSAPRRRASRSQVRRSDGTWARPPSRSMLGNGFAGCSMMLFRSTVIAATSSSVIPMRVYVAISRASFSVTCSAIAILILASVSLPQRAKHALTGHLLTVIHHNKSCRAT